MKDKLFILVGPTAIGKTSLSVNLAKKLDGEIISADSMQIYKYMDVGTAKVTTDEMDSIPHHMIDILDPDEGFTVSNYKDRAISHIKDINNRGKLPMVVGGTGLYVNSLVYDLNFARIPPNETLRQRYEDLAEKMGNEYLHSELMKIDPMSSERISIKDRKRIIRALEVYELTGKTMSEYSENFRKPTYDYDLAFVALNMDRGQLYERINQRVDIMVEMGLIDEVKKILDMGYDRNLVSLKGIGYKEIIMYLNNEISLNDAIEMIKKGSRNYAKRQLTWFRRDNRIEWFNIDDYKDMDELSESIEDYVRKTL